MTLPTMDKLAIRELVARLYRSLDENNAIEFAAEFAPTGVFVSPYGEFSGPEKIQAFLDRHIKEGNEEGVRHFITNETVEALGETARVRFYVLKMNVAVGPAPIASASGDCVVRNTVQGWRFQRFELRIDPAVFNNKQSE